MMAMTKLAPRSSGAVAGLSALLWLFVIIIVVVTSYAIFSEWRKSYWDKQIKEMCDKDGGVTVYEKEKLSRDEYIRLGGNNYGLSIPLRNDSPAFPYFRQIIDQRLRDHDPEIVRNETLITRRRDGKVLAKVVVYWRRGGDFLAIDAESSFVCPSPRGDITKEIFVIEDTK